MEAQNVYRVRHLGSREAEGTMCWPQVLALLSVPAAEGL